MVITVRERGDDLVLCEPIAGGEPDRLGDELTFAAFTAVLLLMQHSVLECEPQPTNAMQTVRLYSSAAGTERLVAIRERPEGDMDSGWRVSGDDDFDGEFVMTTVLHVFSRLFSGGLAMLPHGWRIEVEDGQTARILDERGAVRLDLAEDEG